MSGWQGHARVVQFNVDKVLHKYLRDFARTTTLHDHKLNIIRRFGYMGELEQEISAASVRMQYVPRFLRTRYAQSRGEALTRDLFDRHKTWKEEMRIHT